MKLFFIHGAANYTPLSLLLLKLQDGIDTTKLQAPAQAATRPCDRCHRRETSALRVSGVRLWRRPETRFSGRLMPK
jgi:hypothetical protein